ETLLREKEALWIVQNEIVPALDQVGKAYEEKRAYLPQLLMSADAAKSAFEKIKTHILKSGGENAKKCKVILATVKGDIHDIGKNIVGTLLENYGFEVIDLGRDVPPEKVLEKTLETCAPIVGLSALMTTTLPSMEETVRLLREKAPFAKIMVGGAVLTEDYALKMGADAYAKDGMGAVRYVESIYAKNL
ncbi:MAG: cobalamin-dependent protein, partial [Clostridia bacterium]|nr:cobalamin-dependent protein [Clostridia bacterium]